MATVRTAAAHWQDDVDPHVTLLLLAGALGIHPDEPPPPVSAAASSRHAVLLLVHLLGVRPVAGYLTAVFAEIARTESYD